MSNLSITYDGIFDIAIGSDRFDKAWKNKEMMWSQFVAEISETERTKETHALYMSSKPAEQDRIKDIGGFVGGYLANVRRLKSSIVHRRLITLDVDHANQHFWQDFTMLYGCAAALYSTHKHSPESPRLRLIIPLDRDVFPDEYQAIARRIAGTMGIELFDPTTFQPERLMYWPSTSKDAEYIFEYIDAPWLSAGSILSSYRNWKDISSWPISEKVDKAVHLGIEKQEDPLEKPGIVGAFCRTYTITEVLEKYLSEEYTPCDMEGRYTYTHGSTSGGLVVYDDKFAYSHHSTDPASNKLCNAFDLVRVHKYGPRDEDARKGTPANKLPSYLAMQDLATKDSGVRNRIVKEKVSGAQHDFSGIDLSDPPDPEDEDTSWRDELDVDRKGNIYATVDNLVKILENDPYLKGRLGYDEFEKCEIAVRDLPWRQVDPANALLIDSDDLNIIHYLERVYGISNDRRIQQAMKLVISKNKVHPVRDYLNGLAWDGSNRIDELFVKYLGVEDNQYTREVTRKSLVAAVARIFKPGIKYDPILTLIGGQGIGKSTIFDKLGGRWFSSSFSFQTLSKNETKACEQIQGVWIVEIAELAGMRKADIDVIKNFTANRQDRFRVAYGKRAEKFPRQCVFFATTNTFDFLKDDTGNRRFFPLVCIAKNIKTSVFDITANIVDHIWAEAKHYYDVGESLELSSTAKQHAIKAQKDHLEQHPWQSDIENYLDMLIPKDWAKMSIYDRRNYSRGVRDEFTPEGDTLRDRVCINQIWDELFSYNNQRIDGVSATAIKKCMASIEGWELVRNSIRFGSYGKQRNGYVRTINKDSDMLRSETVNDMTSTM